MTLEPLLRATLRCLLPARVADEAAADLLDEHRQQRAARGAAAAAVFLARESASLLWSAAGAVVIRALRSAVLRRRDLTHAVRSLRRRPWLAVASMLMLGSGLAAVGAAIGLASALLFRPVSERYPDAVWRLASTDAAGGVRLVFSEPELARIRGHLGATANLAAVNLQPVVIRAGGADVQTLAEVVAGPYFELIGLEMSAGRPLVAGDAAGGAPPVAVIGDTLWRDRFGRDAAAIGATLRLNGRAFTIVGVAAGASTSSLLGRSVDAWIAVAHADVMLGRDWETNVERRWWTTIVHVPPGDGPARLDAGLTRAGAGLSAQLPEQWRERRLIRIPGTVITGTQRAAATTLAVVLAALAGLILIAAAANVGGLCLAAAAAERGRAAIHLAIGSGRSALVWRHAIEGALIGAGSSVIALALYSWIRLQLAQVAVLPTLSLRLGLPFDWTVIAAAAAAGIAVGVLLAIGPGLWVMRLDLAATLRDGAGPAVGAGLSRTRRVLVAAQVAISIALLSCAVLFARSIDALDRVDVGFARRGLVALDFDVEPIVPSPSMLPAMARQALDRTASLPGVVASAMASRAPIDASTPRAQIAVPGSDGALADVTVYDVTEGYFDTVGLPIVRGRAFDAADAERTNAVVIVNQTLAARLWPDGDVLGRPLVIPAQNMAMQVIGVARDSKYRSLSEPASPHIYRPVRPSFNLALLVRTQGDPRRAIRDVQDVLDGIGPGVVGFFPRTLDDHLAFDTLITRAAARAAATLGAFALVLSGAGLYGMVAWFVAVRRREIGVRMALGASAADVRRLVVRQAAVAAAPGLIIGSLMAMAITAFGRSLFVGVGAVDPASLLLGAATLALVVIAASYWPSRKATQVDPLIVLRDS